MLFYKTKKGKKEGSTEGFSLILPIILDFFPSSPYPKCLGLKIGLVRLLGAKFVKVTNK